jgi:hypothetical protein
VADGPDGVDDSPDADADADADQIGWAAPDHAAREPAAGSTPPAPPPPPPTASTPLPPTAPMTPPRGVASMPQASVPRRGRGWVVVLVAALTVITLSAIVGTVLFVDRTEPPYDAAHDFLAVVLRFPTAAVASSQLCAGDSDDPEGAVAAIERTFAVNGRATVSVNALGVDRSDDVATVKYSVDPTIGATHTYKLSMREENGTWRACPGDGLHEVAQ